jgi:hypothetical protein
MKNRNFQIHRFICSDDQWGKRWGAEGQYKFDGTPAGFGQATQIEFEVGTYKFTYNSETHVTTYQKISE